MKKNATSISKEKALAYFVKYCSSQEHCEYDIREKSRQLNLTEPDTEDIIKYLTANKFIDSQRYVRAFTNDKYRFNKWGRIKIAYALKQKQLPANEINLALKEINEEHYSELLKSELVKKLKSLKVTDSYQKKAALYRFAASKGFESSVIQLLLDEVLE